MASSIKHSIDYKYRYNVMHKKKQKHERIMIILYVSGCAMQICNESILFVETMMMFYHMGHKWGRLEGRGSVAILAVCMILRSARPPPSHVPSPPVLPWPLRVSGIQSPNGVAAGDPNTVRCRILPTHSRCLNVLVKLSSNGRVTDVNYRTVRGDIIDYFW